MEAILANSLISGFSYAFDASLMISLLVFVGQKSGPSPFSSLQARCFTAHKAHCGPALFFIAIPPRSENFRILAGFLFPLCCAALSHERKGGNVIDAYHAPGNPLGNPFQP
jgi:hypothetical protein